MSVSITQTMALALLGLALVRSSNVFQRAHAWLSQVKGQHCALYPLYVACAAIAALPEFLCSAKIFDFAVLLVKV